MEAALDEARALFLLQPTIKVLHGNDNDNDKHSDKGKTNTKTNANTNTKALDQAHSLIHKLVAIYLLILRSGSLTLENSRQI